MQVKWNRETLVLLPEKAIFLPEHNALLLADLHIGKTAHFRKHGLALSAAAARKDLTLLAALLRKYPAREVYFLGDLFHSDHNQEWELLMKLFDDFREKSFYLVPGNHDLVDSQGPGAQNFTFVDATHALGNLKLCHDPDNAPKNAPSVCGHLHPGYRLQGKGRQTIMVPAFYLFQHLLVLPAFGTLTGLMVPKIGASAAIALVTPSGIRLLPENEQKPY